MLNNLSNIRALYEVITKNIVEPERPQMTLQHGVCVLHAG
jgi:hypothetical protein